MPIHFDESLIMDEASKLFASMVKNDPDAYREVIKGFNVLDEQKAVHATHQYFCLGFMAGIETLSEIYAVLLKGDPLLMEKFSKVFERHLKSDAEVIKGQFPTPNTGEHGEQAKP